ncbi:hypothetical protein GGE07_005500 [Sinorhizobium terangae]|uniref:Uncharacterized protein n=1 Tax=Sinorhizobium terangae TaxID=110322 RepID=A0A6N7LNK3_SINTE|nr:hypothetical protein [Sinorhizobium terangae]MBB4188821.1 hypothetical protein [Sinorhizobium terangae]MQX19327.1 hypothetical protein [Sinorhizobium terangae]
MTKNLGIEAASLDATMERHIVAQRAVADVVREWDEHWAASDVTSVVYASALLDVAREEEETRLSIVQFVPGDNREARQKLIYLVAYLFATRGPLKAEEMEAVISTTEPIS